MPTTSVYNSLTPQEQERLEEMLAKWRLDNPPEKWPTHKKRKLKYFKRRGIFMNLIIRQRTQDHA